MDFMAHREKVRGHRVDGVANFAFERGGVCHVGLPGFNERSRLRDGFPDTDMRAPAWKILASRRLSARPGRRVGIVSGDG